MRRHERSRLALLAGWLFADLFLVLAVMGLANLPARPATPTAAPTPTVTGSPARTAPSGAGLEHRPVSLTIEIPPAAFRDPARREQATRALVTRMNQAIRLHGRQGRQVGFLLVLASGSTQAIDLAMKTADRIVAILRQRDPAIFGRSSGFGYWAGSRSDHLEFQLFFFAR
jgi:hypothetical protein